MDGHEVEVGVDARGVGGVGDGGGPDLGEQLGVDGVDRLLGGVGHGELAEAGAAVVLDGERRAVDVDLDLRRPGVAVGEGHAVLEGGLEHEGLEGGAGLAARAAAVGAPREVDLEGVVVAAADVGADGAVLVERDQRGLRARRDR